MAAKRNSMPSLGLGFNKFFVSKRASMFETQEETPQEKRDRSPCGVLEVSERKLEARKEQERKKAAMARRKRRADPYADQSSAPEDETISTQIQQKSCRHASSAVSVPQVRKVLRQAVKIGECTSCIKLARQGKQDEKEYVPVVWMCLHCGHQGCDKKSKEQHSLNHYLTPRSDNHCLVLSTQTWTVWCYECDCEVLQTSSKKLYELVQMIKRKYDTKVPSETTPSADTLSPTSTGRSRSAVRSSSPMSQSGRARGSSATLIDEKKENSPAKVKGITNLGNTCFFNSVLQVLSQTRPLVSVLDVQLQNGHKVCLPGNLDRVSSELKSTNEKNEAEGEDVEEVELKPLELMLPDGGSLSLSLANFLRDMNGSCRKGPLNPGHLFGQICKKNAQFSGYEQQDAHELLRCLLELLRAEELHRMKRAILKAFALNEKVIPSKVPTKTRKVIQGYGRQATNTIIDQIFGGQLISTIVCEECHWSSQVLEPFMDLSLSISEDKGKPRNFGGSEENIYDSFGKAVRPNSNNSGLSKHQLKKQKKMARKNKRANKKQGRGCEDKSIPDKQEEDPNEELQKRLTEQRQPGDDNFKRDEQRENEKNEAMTAGESKKYKVLMAARSAQRREVMSGGSSDDEEVDEEEEEEDEENNNKTTKNTLLERLGALTNTRKGSVAVKEEEEESEEESSKEETSEETDEEESSEKEATSSSSAKEGNSKESSKSKENSDADEEDNADSEFQEQHMTRQPSIVVVDLNEENEPNEVLSADGRYLSTSASCDQLNYNSASDTSERYYTADGIDEDLDLPVRRYSHREEELSHKLQELKLQRKSTSKESLFRQALKGGNDAPVSRSIECLHEEQEDGNQQATAARRFRQEWLSRSFTTLAPRYQPATMECSIMSGLAKFTAPELLANSNRIICQNCTKLKSADGETEVKSSARKQMMIVCPPAVLTLQLKRFQNDGVRLTKANRYVYFPLVLDLAHFTSTIVMPPGSRILYGLYGIVQHTGRLHNGHYTAYVRSTDTADHAASTSFINSCQTSPPLDASRLENNPPPRQLVSPRPQNTPDIKELEETLKASRWFYISDEHVSQVTVERVLKAQAYLLFYERLH